MISVEIPNDIAEYKPKLLLGFTGRQAALILVTAAVIFLDFHFLKPYVGETISLFLAIIPAFIAACFGWGEKFTPGHVPFEKDLGSVLVQSFVAPKVRKLKTNDTMFIPCDKYFQPIPDEAVSVEVLECVNYVREKTGAADNEPTKAGKKPGNKQQKYVKSKLAML